MLTADLALSWQRGHRTGPRLIDAEDPRYLRVAAGLSQIVREHRGRRRAELEQALEEYVGVGTDYKILRGLVKLLLDRCVFETVCARDPAEVRQALFLKARAHHPVIDGVGLRQQVIAEAAEQLGCAPAELTAGMYADLPANQKLMAFEEVSAEELLDCYNLAQAQALLYRCLEMRLWLEPQEPVVYRRLFEAIKAYRLIHTIKGSPATGYEIRLNGPVSMFHRSQKYGIQMAVFLPALLDCPGWRMQAEIAARAGGRAFFGLSSDQNRLRSHHLGEELPERNPLLEKLVAGWKETGSEWEVELNQEVLDLGESAAVPDLVFRHPKGERVHLEILGFWTPRYLSERLKEFERGGCQSYLVVASEEMRCSREAPRGLPPQVLVCKKALTARDVKAALGRLVDREN